VPELAHHHRMPYGTTPALESLKTTGQWLFLAATLAFGFQQLIYVFSLHLPMPGPPWTQHYLVSAVLTALLLIGVTLTTIIRPEATTLAAALLALLLFIRPLAVYGPGLFADVHNPAPWTSGFELLCLCGASLSLVNASPSQLHGAPLAALGNTTRIGQLLFAAGLIVFGTQHFLYPDFIATLIPTWIPLRLFWAYFVGLAFFATAISIISKKMTVFGATLLGVMFLLWVAMLHSPRVIRAYKNGNEWTSLLIALAMGGASLIIAGTTQTSERHAHSTSDALAPTA
jgi:uncharacterized membrane protein